MMPGGNDPVNENVAWAQWWAFPWRCAHQDWKTADKYAALDWLSRMSVPVNLNAIGIAPCLPAAPTPTLLRLVCASSEQLNLILLLIHCMFNPTAAPPLSKDNQLWCMRLSKALPPGMLLPNDDPLQLLHNWLEPAIWHRLKLRFPYKRVLETEKNHASFENGNGRLDTLCQAFVWRATAITGADAHSHSNEHGDSDVL